MEKVEKAYNTTEEFVLQDFYNAKSSSDMYEAITGKELFSIETFVSKHTDEMAKCLLNKLDEFKNNVIKEEKIKVKEEAFLNDSLISETSIRLNNYCDGLKEKNNLTGNYNEFYIPKLLSPLRDVEIPEEEIKEIINAFLEKEEPEYKDIYDYMESEGRIFLLEDRIKSVVDYGGGCNGANYDYDSIDDTIVIKKHKNDVAKLCVIAHEIAHAIELLKLRKILSREEYLKYRLSTQYGEIYPVTMQFKCQDFLEENNLYTEDIKNVRTRQLLTYKRSVNNMVNNIYGETFYLENFNHDLEYSNALIGGVYLSNQNNKELINKFDKEKLNCRGLDIFDKIGCCGKEFDKTLTKQLKKCL